MGDKCPLGFWGTPDEVKSKLDFVTNTITLLSSVKRGLLKPDALLTLSKTLWLINSKALLQSIYNTSIFDYCLKFEMR